jgi:GDP-L-fucose synthase
MASLSAIAMNSLLKQKVYVAGHTGLVGSALVRILKTRGFDNIVVRTRQELDLTDAAATKGFFAREKPDLVFLAAAKVGGIKANNEFPGEFIRDNLAIQTNVIHEAWKANVKRLLFLGSSCIYPKLAPQPLKESYLLTGPLEPTNRPYALAKIAGIEMCWSYNRQYQTRYVCALPTNLFGPGDNYDLQTSHVIPALIRKFHEAKAGGDATVSVWGTGRARREFLFSDDMADACVHLMCLPDETYQTLLGSDESATGIFAPPVVNVGKGSDISIEELSETIRDIVGFKGAIVFDSSKPDGTPQKLLDVSRMSSFGWKAKTGLRDGLSLAHQAFLSEILGN